MKVTDESFLGKRVRRTIHYPNRGTFCPAVSWTYEGVVSKVRDVAAEAGREWRRYEGEFHVTLSDVTVTPDPAVPLRRSRREDAVVLLGHEDGWEVLR